MDYTRVEYDGADTALIGIRHFDLNQTLDCGQCFRWSGSGGLYRGIAHGRLLELELNGDALVLRGVTPEEFEAVWRGYLDLGRDYGELRSRFAADESLREAVEFSPGLRVMRQEPWEALCTFILSQNSNIPRIKGMVERLCQGFGEPLPSGGFAFPSPERLAPLSEDELAPLRSGYRAPYIIDAARRISEGRLDLRALYALPLDEARRELLQVHGVGPKVAECALLYGLGRVECFPMDVWMKRVMASLYPGGFPEALEDVAGIAQQFLFHWARMNVKTGVLDASLEKTS